MDNKAPQTVAKMDIKALQMVAEMNNKAPQTVAETNNKTTCIEEASGVATVFSAQ